MTGPAVEDMPRPLRGANSPWRLKGTGRPGRAVPSLAAGPPSERAVAIYRELAKGASAQMRRRLPVAVVPVRELARRVGWSRATVARDLEALRARGWLASTQVTRRGGRGGRLRGRAVYTLVMPADAVPAEPRRGWSDRVSGGGSTCR